MTTIAYRDGIMAADSQCSGEATKWGEVVKVYSSSGGWIGGATGDAGVAAEFGLWIAETSELNEVTAPYYCTADVKATVDGLLISPSGTIWCWTGRPLMFALDAPFTAIGSGAQIAIGAMAMGASAERAVEIAAQFDIYTGGRITTLSLSAQSSPRNEETI